VPQTPARQAPPAAPRVGVAHDLAAPLLGRIGLRLLEYARGRMPTTPEHGPERCRAKTARPADNAGRHHVTVDDGRRSAVSPSGIWRRRGCDRWTAGLLGRAKLLQCLRGSRPRDRDVAGRPETEPLPVVDGRGSATGGDRSTPPERRPPYCPDTGARR
jgi:hypothetical protein